MVISIPGGKVIATAHEVMVKLLENRMTLQAQTDDITLLGAPCMLVANGGTVNWSLGLGSEENLKAVSDATGIAIKR
ncbi:DUF3389 domain-containing protein [Grimontia hollisae]|uniref:Uncharacterized protein n=2 Tax=Grimontia hollisae TaxID=673 RepID=D0I5V3_GRIHO|nr:DUF3389 family protein [Grimontia hollisae]AMG29131.1 DUF3389 domain-containing protein [Grimontia hollisae]EEY73267.1 hypothetical protein VHA_001120 [Grimontia hollisae CIP 101886]MDF2185005.1 DUF3389 family protein [Grimontia hollisae]STO76829.1 Protein of uncharacterised function (DUF3389) [Grimontia hollisae]STO98152.1 Protein of uncharacterised function (DUF3389) [Grimontia hollisae]